MGASPIKSVITQLENLREVLQKEQDDSENAHADWENDEPGEDEPDVIDNSDDCDRLDRAINLLEKAVDELDD